MNMQQVRAIAKERGVKVGKMKKFELIREIQSQEGNLACYATDVDGSCDQLACTWRDDCASTAKKAAN
mgnify:CR=1 FL=1